MSETALDWPGFLRLFRAHYASLYRSWFESLPVPSLESGVLLICVDDTARAAYLDGECHRAIVDCMMRLTARMTTLRFVTSSRQDVIASNASPALDEQPLWADYTFDQFVVGPSNRLAHAAARAVCKQPGRVYNPLFMHGSPGVGKTHLLHAVCAHLRSENPSLRVLYVTCESFVNQFIRAIEDGALGEFRAAIRAADLLAIDDIQFLAKRESSQEEFFHTYNTLYHDGHQLLLSADAQPAEIPDLEERLVSRFNWGLVTQIDPPDRETRQAILSKKARLRGCDISEEVLDFIAERVDSNVRTLEGALMKLILETRLSGESISLETARSVLAGSSGVPARPVQVSEIMELISAHYGVRTMELIGRRRTRSIVRPRQVGMFLSRKLTPLSLEEIGAHFGGRDHSTVLHAERTITKSQMDDPELASTLDGLTRQLLSKR